MIKANELKIGNLAQNKLGHIIKLTYIAPNEMNGDFELFPIPLTPEILEKCDIDQIKKISDLINIITTNPETTTYETKDNITFKMTYGWGLAITHTGKLIGSVHNFQNLYFALTGEELEINL